MTLRYGMVFQKGGLHYLTSSSIFPDPLFEGNYNTFTSLGTITISGLQDNELGFLVDATNEILYVAYYLGWPLPIEDRSSYLATYQLPAGTEIQNEKNDASLQYEAAIGTGHGMCVAGSSFMTSSVTGVYVVQLNNAETGLIINKNGIELTTLNTFGVQNLYVSTSGEYIVVNEDGSPYRIEVFQGSYVTP